MMSVSFFFSSLVHVHGPWVHCYTLCFTLLYCVRCAVLPSSNILFLLSPLQRSVCFFVLMLSFRLCRKSKHFKLKTTAGTFMLFFLCVRSMCCTALKFTQNLCISLSLSLSLSLSRSVDGFEVFINNDTHIQSFSAVSLPNYKQRNKKNITVKREILCFVWFTLSN